MDFVNSVWSFLSTTIIGLRDFFGFLTTNIEGLGISPLSIFGIGGFLVIMGLWVFKLINPLS